jgi:predicted O-methyltransferase YrrM
MAVRFAGQVHMARFALKLARYVKTYGELALGARPRTMEAAIDYCLDSPILISQVRSEIVGLGKLLQELAPKRSLEIGTNYGGTLFLLCALSPADAEIISLDLPFGEFGGGYPSRRIPLYRQFPRSGQKLHLLRADSHAAETRARVLRILGGAQLDYVFLDGDHTYGGVSRDFEMYAPLVRSGGIVAFHDIVTYNASSRCEVATFWNEIKQRYRHREFVEETPRGAEPLAITGSRMETAGLGALYMP